jgi:Terminase large subunit, T4likevirus-type, N-terminal
VVTARRLRADIERLKVLRGAASASVPADRLEFARSLGIVPDPWQAELLGSEAPRVLLCCSRQSGKSTFASILALHKALAAPGSLILILAPSERQAKETFGKAARFYTATGRVVPPDSYRKLGMELSNGSRIEALPGTEKTIRGFSEVDLLIVEEAARVADELVYAARPFLAVSGGRLMMLSTPAGRRGVFFEEWTEGEGWERYEVPASECPRISEKFLAEERRSLPRRVFDQEYRCAFVETDDAVFTFEDVAGALDPGVTPLFPGEASS